jgi:hypothetical protein
MLALCLTIVAMVALLRPQGWSLTALPRVDGATGMGAAARAIDPSFHTVHPGAYDGQFYWGLAVDPIATGTVHKQFDNTPYRYGHPLFGWLGWLFSAGQARAAPAALVVVGLLSMLVAGVAAGLLGTAAGGRGWEGLFVALNPGLLYAAAHDLSEPLCAALTTVGLLAFVRGRRGIALACFVLLPLSKEPLVLVPLGLAAWGLLRRRIDLRGAVALCATVLPSVVWWVWLRVHLGAWFFSGEHTAFRSPLHGWERAIVDAGIFSYATDPLRNQIGEASLFVVVALGGLLLVATVAASRFRDPVDAVFLPLVVLVACLSPAATTNERDILRVTSIVVLLVPFVLLSRPHYADRPSKALSNA